MYNTIKVPGFDMEKLPFVISRMDEEQPGVDGFYLINIKTCTYQLLTEAKTYYPGFCLKLEDGSFDFHFTHSFTDENNVQQFAHHRVCIRNDLLEFLKEHGQLPCMSLKDNEELLKKEKQMSQDNKELSYNLEIALRDLATVSQEKDELVEKVKMMEATLAEIMQTLRDR